MNFKSIYPWILRILALIGIISIVIFIGQNLFARFVNQSIETMAVGKGAIAYPEISMDSAMAYEERSIMAIEPNGVLYDEDIADQIDEKIIQTGSLELVVDHAEESVGAIQFLAQTAEGYVSSSSVFEHEDGTKSGYITIRVPSESFDEVLSEIKHMAIVVERETISSEDVTERYIDLAARLKNAQAQESRYVEILEEAKSVEDILQIEQALGNVRSTIESLTGQIQYLDSQTGFSTISINLSEEPVVTIGGKEFRPGTTVKQAGQAVVAIVQWLIEALIWIAIVGIAIGVPLLLIVWLILKGVKKHSHK